MTTKHTDEFKRETVRIALTSGLSRERVAADMGIGKSTLGITHTRWRPDSAYCYPVLPISSSLLRGLV
jgi:transposase